MLPGARPLRTNASRRWPHGLIAGLTLLGCAATLTASGRNDDAGAPPDRIAAPVQDVATPDLLASPGCDDAGTVGPWITAPCTALPAPRDVSLRGLGGPGNLTSLVWNGSDYAFLWVALENTNPGHFGLFFGRVGRDGETVPDSVHRVFSADRFQTQGVLAVGDEGYGLAYLDLPRDGQTAGIRAYFARLDRNGVLVRGSERQLSELHPPHQGVAIAYSPPLRQWAVAWQGQVPLGGGGVESHTYLTRLGAACGILAPNAVQLDALRSTTGPDHAAPLVWARDRFAIALPEYVSIPNTRVVIAEIDPVTAAVSRRILLHEGGRPTRVALATDGTMYGAAWMQLGLETPTTNAIWFRRAAVGGDALGEAAVLSPGGESGEPTVRFDGDSFRVAYAHNEAAVGGVWLARFARGGALLGTPGMRVVGTPPYSAFPLLASDGCNDAIGWTATIGVSPQQSIPNLHLHPPSAE
ncbi:MAG: hypothetical protein U0325_28390 [Polyangiales bacterium]